MVARPLNRWLILSQYYPPEIGAPQIRLRSIARELHGRGFEVRVLTAMPNYPAGKIFPGYEGRWRVQEDIDGIRVVRTWVYAGTGKSAIVRLANYLSFTFTALLAALFGARPDVLFVESQPLSLGLIAILMKWLRGVPYIYNVPDLQIQVAQQLGFMHNRQVLRVAWNMENFFLRQSWKVSTVTQRFVDHFNSRGVPRRQITFLPNGADTAFLKPEPPSLALLDRWNLHGKTVFVYVGTHAFYHGLDTIVQAAAILKSRQEIHFLMIGDGPERERIRRMANDMQLTNMTFGDSPYEEMDKLYSISYASIATLRNMPVSRDMRLSKIFPSLCCAVPVIYSGLGEAGELLEANHCGIQVQPEDAGLLSEQILKLAGDQTLRDKMGQAGRDLVEREYGWSTIVEKWLKELSVPESSLSVHTEFTENDLRQAS